MANFIQVNHEQLRTQMRIAYASKIPLFIWGSVGIGKSVSVREFSKEMAGKEGREFKEWNDLTDKEKESLIDNGNVKEVFLLADLRASEMDMSDTKGLPDFTSGKEYICWKPDLLFKVFSNEDIKGVIFFDELNLASPSLQATLYKIINDRQAGDIKLNDDVMIVSAGNRVEDRANVKPLPMPLRNRFSHVELNIPSVDEWSAWANTHEISGEIISFLNWKNNYLFTFNPEKDDTVFATPRSWAMADRKLRALNGVGIKDLKDIRTAIGSCVGDGIGMEYISYHKLIAKININELLKNPEQIAKLKEVSEKYAVIGTLLEVYKKNNDKLDKIIRVCPHFKEKEYAVLLMRWLKGIDPKKFVRKVLDDKFFKEKFAKEYGELIVDLE